ncbi:hypothetical protein BHE74_00009525 [Ensete ventricosum]|nr:hypothetical protein BHE74_00009525 [Ensete ventricosum]RZR92267.1 hypothetical protein BHM03_00020512 [Ensete ventricosum]
MFGQSQVQASGQGLNNAIGNLPGVRRKLVEGIGSLQGWHKGVRREDRDSLEDCRGFTEGIRKLTENTKGDHRKKTKRLAAKMLEATGLAGGLVFTQRRSVVDTGVPQGGGLESGRRPVGAEPL